jgi:NTE family protein
MRRTSGKTALVLGSGGARGIAHIGVLKWLEENGAAVDLIVGTSIGALIGGFYAAGIRLPEMEAILAHTDKLTVAKILRPGLSSSGIVDNDRVRKFLKKLIGEKKIEALPLPFRAVSTDLVSGEEVVFDRGSLADAILASIAIPAVFQPVYHQGRYLVDGGLSNPLPVSIAQRMSAARTIAVNVSPNPETISRRVQNRRGRQKKRVEKLIPAWLSDFVETGGFLLPKSVLNRTAGKNGRSALFSPTLLHVFLQSVSISTNNLIVQRLQLARPTVLISPKVEEFGMLEFYRGREIVPRGYDAAAGAASMIHSLPSGSME